MTANTLSSLIVVYLSDCAANGKSECTLQNYRGTLDRFARFIGPDSDIAAIRTADIAAFKASLGDVKVTTLNLHLEHLRLFFDWAAGMEIIPVSPVKQFLFPNKKNVSSVRARPIEEKLTVEEALSMLTSAKPTWMRTRTFPRNQAIAAMLITGGFRNQELAALRPCDLDFLSGCVTIHHGKGNKFRTVPFPQIAQDLVRAYLASGYRPERLTDTDPLFGTVPKGTDGWTVLDRHVLSEIVRRTVDSVTGKDKIRSHKLRHAFASVSREMGMSKEDIQECLGHASLDTTERYLDRLNPEAAPKRMNDMWDLATHTA